MATTRFHSPVNLVAVARIRLLQGGTQGIACVSSSRAGAGS